MEAPAERQEASEPRLPRVNELGLLEAGELEQLSEAAEEESEMVQAAFDFTLSLRELRMQEPREAQSEGQGQGLPAGISSIHAGSPGSIGNRKAQSELGQLTPRQKPAGLD